MLSYCLRVALAALVLLCPHAGSAQSTGAWSCQAPLCNPQSRHGTDMCVVSESGGLRYFGDGVSGNADVATAVMYSCEVYKREHPGVNWACSPQLPAPDFSFGSQWGSFKAQGRMTAFYPDGSVYMDEYRVGAGAACQCNDSRNVNVIGIGADGACYCKANLVWDSEIHACVAPPIDPVVITLSGPRYTKALPAGPALPFVASVRQGGKAQAGKLVTISRTNGPGITGVTDSNGAFRFTYVPPVQRELSDELIASCGGCSNTDGASIEVTHCDVCEPGFGNPIQPATGEKQQTEADWIDASPHALSLTRYYRSQGNAGARMGPNWSHDFAAKLVVLDVAKLALGQGRTAMFFRIEDRWLSENPLDQLIDLPDGGMQYTRGSDETRFRFDAASRLASITQRNGWVMSLTYNAAGFLSTVTNAFGRTLQFGYDASGSLTTVTTPDGKTIGYGYDGSRLTLVTLPGGASRRYHYEDTRFPNALTGITDEAGQRYASFTYDGLGRAISSEHAGVSKYTASYGASPGTANALVPGHAVDASIYRMSAQVTDPNGSVQSYVWIGGAPDGQVRRLSASGPFEGETIASRNFTPEGLPEIETDFLGVATAHLWDPGRQLKLATQQAVGRPEAQTTYTQWHPSFRLPVLVTEAGRTTAYTYDALGNTLSETVTDTSTGQARAWSWTYSARGLPETMTDPKGGAWRYEYDSAGNLTRSRDPLGRETTSTFDAAGRVLTQTEPGGTVSSYSYDARGRLLTASRGGETSSYSYTPHGLLASATLPNGYQVGYSYDNAQRLVAATDNRGASIAYTLDNAGNRIREEVKDGAGNIALATSRVINNLNRVAAVQGAQGQTTQIGYDANGEPVNQTDPLNQTTRQGLDGLRRPTATTFPDNASAAQAWNQLDQLTQVTDPKGVATRYTYNAFGEVMSETSPDIGTMRYTRDAAGDVIAIEDAKGQVNRIERDALGRITRIEYAANHVVSYGYDAAGYVSRIEDQSGSTDYQRDALGRITGKTQRVNDNPSNPSSFALAYGYANGELASIRYPSGLVVSYRRTAGRITGIDVQAPGQASVTPFVSNLAHTPLGQPKSWNWSNGAAASRTFDADGRMVGNEFASYGYDAAGRITRITQQLWAQRTNPTTGAVELFQLPIHWTAGYDNRNRLTSFVRDGAETHYTYDANSNRLTALERISGTSDFDAVLDGDNKTQSTDQLLNIDAASNRLLGFTQTVVTLKNGQTATVVTTPVNYTVDANGAMTSDGLRTFDYDESRRLSKVRILRNGEAASISYLHNALGQRVFKGEPQAEQTLPSEDDLGKDFITWLRKQFGWLFTPGNHGKTSLGQAFVYGDGAIPPWAMLGEYDNGTASGKGRTEYLWLPTEDGSAIPVGMYRGGQFYAVQADHLGTPRLITDAANKTVWQWPYSGFGNNKPTGVVAASTTSGAASIEGAKAAIEVNHRFPGQYFDIESELTFNFHRSFQLRSGRYSQPDPVGISGGLSRFAYADSNPISKVDPEGLAVWSVLSSACRSSPAMCAALAAATIVKAYESCISVGNELLRRLNTYKDDVSPDESNAPDASTQSDVTKRPSRVRKGTEQANWENAEDGENGGKICSTCEKEVVSKPGEKGKDWDNDHHPAWRFRDLLGKNRKEVLDEYNSGTRLRCIGCNRSDNGHR
jgi:RHS repeat-associated protein